MTEREQQYIFQEWLSLHKGLIFKILRSYAREVMDQDDLFQEIIIQVWHSIPSFRNESSVTTWLYRISLNTAIKWTTKERKKAKSNATSGRRSPFAAGKYFAY